MWWNKLKQNHKHNQFLKKIITLFATYQGFFIFLTALCLPESWGGCTYGQREAPPLDELAVHGMAICKHLWVRNLAQRYLSSALKVFWQLPPWPEHLPCVVCTGAQTRNPSAFQLHSQQTEQLLPQVKDNYNQQLVWEQLTETRKTK